MAIEGRLSVGGAADLLSALWFQGRSGILELALQDASRKLVYADGEVIYVVSPVNAERLPVRLAARGLVDRAALVEAVKAGGDLRQVLVDRGVLAGEAHDAELGALIAEVVATVFPQVNGKWSFTDRSDLKLDGSLDSLAMEPILWRAARQCTPAFATTFLGDLGQRVIRSPDDAVLSKLSDLTPQEGFVISRIDGYSSARDLCLVSPAGEEATLSLLFGLTCVGFTEITGRPGVRLPRPPKNAPARKAPAAPRAAPKPAAVTPMATAARTEEPPPVVRAAALDVDPVQAARELHARTENADHYAVLGVTRTASSDEIRRAYYALARVHHPDRHAATLAPADREFVESLFARIGDAFSVLSAEDRRAEYDQKLASGALEAERQEAKAVDPRDLARDSSAKGRAALASGDKGRAVQYFEHAVQADPTSWEHRMTLARLLVSDSRTRRRAEQHLIEAIHIDQSKPEAYLELGHVYAAANLKSRALEQYRKGLSWDGTHSGLLTAVAELDGGGGDDSGGLLGGLFGKKKT